MNTRDFVYHLLNHGRQLVRHDPHSEFRPETAILSSLMDFPCEFKDGKCAGKRHSPKCCCINCVGNIGHFGSMWPNNLRTLDKYAKMFTAKNGFWRPGKGCVLPRHMRSLTCAFHVCQETSNRFDKRNSKELCQLRVAAGEYTACSYRYGSRAGIYHKEVVKTEKKVTEAVNEVMLKEKLYFDAFKEELVNVVRREKKGEWTSLHLENGMRVDVNMK